MNDGDGGLGCHLFVLIELLRRAVLRFVNLMVGVNFSLVTTVAITLANPFNMGIAIGATGQVGQVQVSDVVLTQAPNDGDIIVKEVIGPDGGIIFEVLYDDPAAVPGRPSNSYATLNVIENAFLRSEEISFSISTTNDTSYPDIEGLEAYYPTDKLRYIGPLVTFDVPTDLLNFNLDEKDIAFIIRSSLYTGEYEAVGERDIRFELRIDINEDMSAFYTRRYGFTGEVVITNGFLQATIGDEVAETITISVQAVDVSEALPNPRSP
ncbi:MAG: hypothetical protein AAF267_12145 [Deinococcota bacterium]